MNIFEIDYSLKDVEKFKAAPKELPSIVVADNVAEAVKRAKDWEDDNCTLLKCDLLKYPAVHKIAVQKKYKGIEPVKETA